MTRLKLSRSRVFSSLSRPLFGLHTISFCRTPAQKRERPQRPRRNARQSMLSTQVYQNTVKWLYEQISEVHLRPQRPSTSDFRSRVEIALHPSPRERTDLFYYAK